MLFLLSIFLAYLLGSVSNAIIAAKLVGLPDPRSQGSGNPGATNILRIGSKKLAVLVLLGDVTKGVIAVLLAKFLGLSTDLLGCVALAAFLGHLFPVFFGFKGGKGVATAFGGILTISWQLGLLLIVTWLCIAFIFRYSSLAAIITALLVPVYAWWLLPMANYLPVAIMTVLLLITHRANIQRLLSGHEQKIGKKNK